MRLGTVVGNVVATAHHPTYDGKKIMVVKNTRPDGTHQGRAILAVDLVQAGPGDRVLLMSEGNGVRQLLGSDSGPIRTVIVGVVNDVHTEANG